MHERTVARCRARGQHTLPLRPLGWASGNLLGLWAGLSRFLDELHIPCGNNTTDQALRSAVVGRKNHYGSCSRRGTEVAALYYSLLETAKLVGVEPKSFLR